MALNTIVSFIYHFVVLLLLLQLVISKCNGFTLKLIHRDSIESPLYPGNLTLEERVARLRDQTDVRINYYAAKIAIAAASEKLQVNQSEYQLQPEVIRPRIIFQDSFYLAKVGIGTFDNLPTRRNYINYFLMVDTGSNLIWTQCQPCEKCYTQAQQLFPYKRSRTYELLPCNSHRLCYPNICKNQICSYDVEYATGQTTSGYIGRDRFAFEVRNGATDSVYNIVFGCGTNQKGITFPTTPNHISGIIGMGSGHRSLVNQLGSRAGEKFSYCIPRWKNNEDNIYLRFGQEATFKHGQQVRITPFRKGPLETYYVTLLDISVNGNHLHFPPGYFDIKHDGSGGCVIDSGSPFNALPQEAYISLMNAVTQYFAHMGVPTKHIPDYDLCFQKPGPNQPYPLIVFHLDNADLQVGTAGFFSLDDGICLAFRSSGDLGGISAIIGGHAQSNYRFVFNLVTSTVSFAVEDCKTTS